MDERTLVLRDYRTPVSDYPKRKLGRAEIGKQRVSRGATFYAEGVRGMTYFKFPAGATITTLKIGGKVWMTDDAAYTFSLESFAERAKRQVLVAGLGLGIVVHQLVKNPAVTRIDVVDRELDVIRLVQPLLPHDERIRVHHEDFYDWCDRVSMTTDYVPDAAIWDLAVGTKGEISEGKEIALAKVLVAARWGSHRWDREKRQWVERQGWKPFPVFVHGLDRDPAGAEFVKIKEFQRTHEIMKR